MTACWCSMTMTDFPRVDEQTEQTEQMLDLREVQAGGGFVQHVSLAVCGHVDGHVDGELESLSVAAGEGG